MLFRSGKAQVGAGGFGCEPASGASIAGAKLLRAQGIIAPSDRVVCILTGHQLKDSTATVGYHAGQSTTGDTKSAAAVSVGKFANRPVVVENDLDRIMDVLRGLVG